MTDGEILAIARDVGWNTEHRATNDYLVRFAALIEKKVRDHERAACLEIVEKRGLFDATPKQVEGYNLARDNIAAAIRSRT